MNISSVRFFLTSFWLIFGFLATSLAEDVAVLAAKPAISQPLKTKNFTVGKAEFGVRIVDSQGKANFFPTVKVPLKKGDAYGWKIELNNYQGTVKWREVLTLPKAPETWATPEQKDNFSLSGNGKTAITKRTQTTTNGVIENYWQIAPGDPLGQHKIEVYVDDRLIATFEFETVEF
ncbi:hypothetical protein WJM97_01015 [Okeanomitos corallinicola TIOX110]|uniref:Proteinase inhibitor I42 chagasin domain-containing protein n=1 Tax=Okeanomitos corallinicola TIOX110 TaxID=3133117 RepID=A0ABZ2UVV3_9CYAN